MLAFQHAKLHLFDLADEYQNKTTLSSADDSNITAYHPDAVAQELKDYMVCKGEQGIVLLWHVFYAIELYVTVGRTFQGDWEPRSIYTHDDTRSTSWSYRGNASIIRYKGISMGWIKFIDQGVLEDNEQKLVDKVQRNIQLLAQKQKVFQQKCERIQECKCHWWIVVIQWLIGKDSAHTSSAWNGAHDTNSGRQPSYCKYRIITQLGAT